MPLTSRLRPRSPRSPRRRANGATHTPLAEDSEKEREERYHGLLRQQVLSHVAQFRARVGIDPLWQIDVELFCPPREEEECSDDGGTSGCVLPNASISWIRDSWHATLRIRCDLPYQQRRRETLHELVELSFHGTGELWYFIRDTLLRLTDGVPTDLWTYLDNEYRIRRNQEVEKVVRLLLLAEEESSL